MKTLWETCRLATAIGPIGGALHRLVESQEQVATMQLVDTLEAQALLESMLDKTKPAPPSGSENLHYLLYTPFRYPPLAYGSRYGARNEPSLFYGALGLITVLAEAAYYRLVFWYGMEVPPGGPLRSEHTLFSARYATDRGLHLQDGACVQVRATLTDPADYSATQALGTAMREAGIEAFEFPSARCPEGGTNVALFSPAAFASPRPENTEQWLCETTPEGVTFSQPHSRDLRRFGVEKFLVKGKFQWPVG